MEQIKSDLYNLKNQIKEINGRLLHQSGRLDKYSKKVESLDNGIVGTMEKTGLKQRVDTVENTMNMLRSDISQINKTMSRLLFWLVTTCISILIALLKMLLIK